MGNTNLAHESNWAHHNLRTRAPQAAPTLTTAEDAALKKLEKICQSPRPNQLTTCALLKQMKIAEYNQQQAEIKAAALEILNTQRLEASTYITVSATNALIMGQLLSNALQKASGEYDQILAARARQPILGQIILGLALTVLPELMLLSKSMKSMSLTDWEITKGVAKTSSTGDWEQLADQISTALQAHPNPKVEKFVETLDGTWIGMVDAIKDPMASNSDFDNATNARLSAFNAKNQILTSVIKNIENRLVAVSRLQLILYRFVIWYSGNDVLTKLKNLMKITGFDVELQYSGSSFDKLSDLVLYDMLRAYVRQHCKASIEEGSQLTEDTLEGLDQAQAKLIYDRFGLKNWQNPPTGYPAVSNISDLIFHWGLPTETYNRSGPGAWDPM